MRLVSNRLAYRPGAAPVDDAHLDPAGERGRVDQVSHLLARLLCGASAKVDLVGQIVLDHRPDGDCRLRTFVRLRVPVGLQPGERDPRP